ncbi:MAG TPA: glycosyltransferase family 2 protein [Pirellulales bacterium]|jgi:dolichol-phosphate mannosyltransferase|nr:glycosyltransferase family 2 protein [Pirellulales bacterium]
MTGLTEGGGTSFSRGSPLARRSGMAGDRPVVSIVVAAYNEADCLGQLHEELCRALDALPYRFEFLFVDDGSHDETMAVLDALRQRDGRVRFLSLSRNFGHQAALSAGLEHAEGDAVVTIDGDLQHPPAVIPQLIERWQAGYEVVNTVRLRTEKIAPHTRLLSAAFYRVFNWAANIHIEPGGADFRLMARPAVNALVSLPEVHRFLRGLVPWLGFRQTHVEFVAAERFAGRSKYTFWRSLRFALDGITAFSFYPLRRLTIFGWIIALASCVYALIAVGAHLFGQRNVAGWTSLLLCILFFGGCQLILAGVLGEYLGRVLEQVKNRPLYVVRKSVGLQSAELPLLLAPAASEREIIPFAAPEDLAPKGFEHVERSEAA